MILRVSKRQPHRDDVGSAPIVLKNSLLKRSAITDSISISAEAESATALRFNKEFFNKIRQKQSSEMGATLSLTWKLFVELEHHLRRAHKP
jgi:hypothetical protein